MIIYYKGKGTMKKFLFIFLIIGLVSGTYAKEFKFMGGLNFSNYAIRPEVNFDIDKGDEYSYEINNITSFLIGGGIEFSIARNIALEIDGFYFQKGSRIHQVYYHIEIYVVPWEYTLNVISIPAMFKIKILPSFPLYLLGGEEFSFISSHRYVFDFGDYKGDEQNVKENTRSFDYGLIFGAGYEMKLLAISFFIEGRYHLGLSNISKGMRDWESLKTRSIVLILGFKI